jgi:hypothetical protein
MTNLAFEAGPDEDVAPACVVVRRMRDGSYTFTLIEGGDDEIVRMLATLEVATTTAGGVSEMIEEQAIMLDERDIDLETLIADKLSREKRVLNKEQRIAQRVAARKLERQRERKAERLAAEEAEEDVDGGGG